MEITELLSTPSCGDENNDDFISFMSYNTAVSILIALLCATIIFCCLSLILCFIVCTLCHRRHRTSDLQDLPKSNGYVMPVVREEKDHLETQEPSTDTFKSDTQQAITHEDIQNDIIHNNKTQRKDSQLTPLVERDLPFQKLEVDVNNPLYIKHISSSNNNSMDRKESIPTSPYTQFVTTEIEDQSDENDYENNSEFDYENTSTVRLAKMIAKQGVSLPAAVPTSPTSPNSKQVPPETKPKPKNRPRTQSSQSEKSQTFNTESDEEEPRYMSPRHMNQIPWKPYKELDFSTVDPSADYTVPTREFLMS